MSSSGSSSNKLEYLKFATNNLNDILNDKKKDVNVYTVLRNLKLLQKHCFAMNQLFYVLFVV